MPLNSADRSSCFGGFYRDFMPHAVSHIKSEKSCMRHKAARAKARVTFVCDMLNEKHNIA